MSASPMSRCFELNSIALLTASRIFRHGFKDGKARGGAWGMLVSGGCEPVVGFPLFGHARHG